MGLRTIVKRWIGGIVRGTSSSSSGEAIPKTVSMSWSSVYDDRAISVSASYNDVSLTVRSQEVRISGN